jgi:hypothetical protein
MRVQVAWFHHGASSSVPVYRKEDPSLGGSFCYLKRTVLWEELHQQMHQDKRGRVEESVG